MTKRVTGSAKRYIISQRKMGVAVSRM